jgi:transcriptional regulator with GAF, ATPase, and Fis domain
MFQSLFDPDLVRENLALDPDDEVRKAAAAVDIRSVLDSTNWRVRGAGGAAERLGLKPTTLESRMARLGLRRKQAP